MNLSGARALQHRDTVNKIALDFVKNPTMKVRVVTAIAKSLILKGTFYSENGRQYEWKARNLGCGVKELYAEELPCENPT